jgi:protein SCO1/2
MFRKRQIWRRTDRRWIVATLTLVGILSLSACSSAAAPAAIVDEPLEQQGTPVEPPRQLTDFSLPSSTGETLSLSDLRGKLVLVYFGYTFCPDFCPMTLADFARVKQELGAQADQVTFMMISVDSERDRPEVLARYMSAFDEDFIGLTGDTRTLRRIGPEYGLYYEVREVEGTSAAYLVDHSTPSYLIDKEGRMRMIYSHGTPPEVISADIQALLAEDA